jgi:hypothetical protein
MNTEPRLSRWARTAAMDKLPCVKFRRQDAVIAGGVAVLFLAAFLVY